MLQISKEQLYSRYDSLPQILKDALFSEETDDLLWKIGDAHHLSDDKKSTLATLVGDVILGFVHSDDLEKQISIDLGIDARIAQSLVAEISKKILAPVINEIEQNYKPPVAIADIKRIEVPPQPIAEEIKPAPIAVEPSIAAIKPEVGIEKPMEAAKPETLFEAPAIIHKEEKAQAVTPAKVSLGGLMGIFKRTVEKTEAPQVAAEVQLGVRAPEGAPPEQPPIAQTEKPKMRVVHYGDLRTPITPVEIFGKAEGVPPVISTQPIPPIAEAASGVTPEAPKIEILKPAAPKIEEVVSKEPVFKRVDFKEEIPQPVKIQPEPVKMPAVAEALASKPKPEPTKPIAPAGEEKREISLKEIPVSEEVLDLRTLEKSTND